MNTDISRLSNGFQRLYCDAAIYEPFSTRHPIGFAGVLPFQPHDAVADDDGLVRAETAHLAGRTDDTRRAVVDAYARSALLPRAEAESLLSVIRSHSADFTVRESPSVKTTTFAGTC